MSGNNSSTFTAVPMSQTTTSCSYVITSLLQGYMRVGHSPLYMYNELLCYLVKNTFHTVHRRVNNFACMGVAE